MSMEKTIPETSADTRLLYARLQRAEVGEVVTYPELSEIVGVPIHRRWHCLETARRMALRQLHAVFEPVRGMGLKRLADTEIVAAGRGGAERIRRTAKRSAQKLASVNDYAALSDVEKHTHNALLSVYAAIHQVASPTRLKKLEAAVAQSQQQLPVAKTLELFK